MLKTLELEIEAIQNAPRVITIDELKQKAAHREYGIDPPLASHDLSRDFPEVHRTLTEDEAITEASRCLLCDDFCSVCVGVCPNLANLTYFAKPNSYSIQEGVLVEGEIVMKTVGTFQVNQKPQIINIGDFCNECGNCSTFCPTAGDPYKDKPRFHLSEQSFTDAESGYQLSGKTLKFKDRDYQAVLTFHEGDYLYHSPYAQVRFDGHSGDVDSINLEPESKYFSTLEAMEMIVLYESLKGNPIFY